MPLPPIFFLLGPAVAPGMTRPSAAEVLLYFVNSLPTRTGGLHNFCTQPPEHSLVLNNSRGFQISQIQISSAAWTRVSPREAVIGHMRNGSLRVRVCGESGG